MNSSFNKKKIISIALLFLTGCATLSENDCRTGDWYGVGLRDGADGLPLSRLVEHHDACGEYGIAINGDEYRAGRERGLRQFCTAENGARFGRQGGVYANVCPEESEENFLRAYKIGHRIWQLEQEITSLDARIEEIDKNLEKKDLEEDKRRALRREREEIFDERDDVRDELRLLDVIDLIR
ncbi:MAG: DUF2799 domain-containing protein [Deltaproteobacteria bacterium]|nr:DUF2799 domain-containing protein [Deltaproteobacteria bacterium]